MERCEDGGCSQPLLGVPASQIFRGQKDDVLFSSFLCQRLVVVRPELPKKQGPAPRNAFHAKPIAERAATANIWGLRGPHRWYLVTLKGWKLDNLITANDSCGRSDTVDPQIDQNVSTVSNASPMMPDGRQARQRPLSLFTSKYLLGRVVGISNNKASVAGSLMLCDSVELLLQTTAVAEQVNRDEAS